MVKKNKLKINSISSSFKNIHFILIIGFCLNCFSQNLKYPTGIIIDSIEIKGSIEESFTLYLPKNYTPSYSSPIVFVFDPMGRGKTGIEPFIKVSETYNYIIICSNNIRNGPYESNLTQINRLFNTVLDEFNVNERRIYTSGFSGGSRLASKVAILSNQIQGVVACGAGFSSKLDLIGLKHSFSYSAIIGDEDMNYSEMIDTKNTLDKLKVENELFIYEINHKWPSQEQIKRAFDWLQLEAYRKNLIPNDSENTKAIYTDYSKFAAIKNSTNQFLAIDEYKRIYKNFKRYYQLDSVKNNIESLKSTKILKKEQKIHDALLKEENLLTIKFKKKFNTDFDKKTKNTKWWASEISKLQKKKDNAAGLEKKMLKRIMNKIFALSIETVSLEGVVNINQSILCYDICILTYPKHQYSYFKQIENYLKINDEDSALDYLEKLILNGYDDIDKIKANPIFTRLHSNSHFLELTSG